MLRNASISSIVSTVKASSTGVVCAFGFRSAAGVFGTAIAFGGNNRFDIDKLVTLDNPAYSLVSSERFR
ncbi:MAG TPA: hypothetical protein VHT96_16770 [Clostridia bacterium]|nr:hypothetical protein [Clostridia bacterium]